MYIKWWIKYLVLWNGMYIYVIIWGNFEYIMLSWKSLVINNGMIYDLIYINCLKYKNLLR